MTVARQGEKSLKMVLHGSVSPFDASTEIWSLYVKWCHSAFGPPTPKFVTQDILH